MTQRKGFSPLDLLQNKVVSPFLELRRPLIPTNQNSIDPFSDLLSSYFLLFTQQSYMC